ncbi:hypothetical protein F4859DRAFT_483663 [Xylaria cf. heliscus]|nr:hypothetical protein F4859DRAFT_483663 [Xylaria cf. heliscus]
MVKLLAVILETWGVCVPTWLPGVVGLFGGGGACAVKQIDDPTAAPPSRPPVELRTAALLPLLTKLKTFTRTLEYDTLYKVSPCRKPFILFAIHDAMAEVLF